MGYKMTKKDATIAPGPGRYNVRTKLRSEKDEDINRWTPVKKKKKRMKIKKKKRKAKSRAGTTRSKISTGRK